MYTVFMLVTFIRTLIIFIALVVVMRLMGKRQIGEMQPFELVLTLIIADLACVPMADVSIPLIYGIVGIFALFLLHQIFSVIEQSGQTAKNLISGKPSVVINKNGVDMAELRRNNMDISDLIESMRSLGYFSLDAVDYAIFESNGKLSALEKKDGENIGGSLPVIMAARGKIIARNVDRAGIETESIIKFLTDNGGTVKQTEVLTVDGSGRAYLKLKGKKYVTASFPLSGETLW